MQELPAVMTLKEVGAHLRCDRRTISNMVRFSGLPAFRLKGQYRVNLEDLREWIFNQQVNLQLERTRAGLDEAGTERVRYGARARGEARPKTPRLRAVGDGKVRGVRSP